MGISQTKPWRSRPSLLLLPLFVIAGVADADEATAAATVMR